jgi:hypothetical protein
VLTRWIKTRRKRMQERSTSSLVEMHEGMTHILKGVLCTVCN